MIPKLAKLSMSKDGRLLVIRLNDNDFYNTFIPLLNAIAEAERIEHFTKQDLVKV